jgi:hypothetical protein
MFPAQTVLLFSMGLMVAGLVVMARAVRLATAVPAPALEVVPA